MLSLLICYLFLVFVSVMMCFSFNFVVVVEGYWLIFFLVEMVDLSFILLLVYVMMGSLSDLVVGIVVVVLFLMVFMLG